MSSGQFRVRVLPSCDISMPISGDTTSGAMEAGRGAAAAAARVALAAALAATVLVVAR